MFYRSGLPWAEKSVTVNHFIAPFGLSTQTNKQFYHHPTTPARKPTITQPPLQSTTAWGSFHWRMRVGVKLWCFRSVVCDITNNGNSFKSDSIKKKNNSEKLLGSVLDRGIIIGTAWE